MITMWKPQQYEILDLIVYLLFKTENRTVSPANTQSLSSLYNNQMSKPVAW